MSQYSQRLYNESWWRKLRYEVIYLRANGRCEVRTFGCQGKATQVHHVTYPVGRREQHTDLVACCDMCHYLMHYPPPANDNDDEAELPLVANSS